MHTLSLGPLLPRRGNRFSRALGRGMLRWAGWGFDGAFPNARQLVIIVAPHTSNWDFYVGMGVVFALGVRVSWMGKHTLFVPPLGWLMRWLGGLPIDRHAASGVVAQTVQLFGRHDQLLMGLAPEGTRGKVSAWKSGFHHIARGANVPILPVAFDYGTNTIRIGAVFEATDDFNADLVKLKAFYQRVKGKCPDRM